MLMLPRYVPILYIPGICGVAICPNIVQIFNVSIFKFCMPKIFELLNISIFNANLCLKV